MTKNSNETILCVSVFKNGNSTNVKQFTQAWIDMINRIEKSKALK